MPLKLCKKTLDFKCHFRLKWVAEDNNHVSKGVIVHPFFMLRFR